MGTVGAEELLVDPTHLLVGLAEPATATFRTVDAEFFRTASFLDDRRIPDEFGRWAVDLDQDIVGAVDSLTRPDAYVFHTAFCGSTLLMRALGELDSVLALREPGVLKELAIEARHDGIAACEKRVELALGLLGKRFTEDQSVIIKPANQANVLADQLMRATPGAKSIILFAQPRVQLGKFLKPDRIPWTVETARLIASASPEVGEALDAAGEDPTAHAAALWALQLRELNALRESMPGRSLAIDAQSLFGSPGEVLSKVCEFLGVDLPEGFSPTVVGTHSKSGVSMVEYRAKEAQLLDSLALSVDRALKLGIEFGAPEFVPDDTAS